MVALGLIAAGVLVPLLMVISAFAQPVDDVWPHFTGGLLNELIVNTLKLLTLVLFGTFILGVGLAWLTAACDFPGRAWLEWLLVLPFAFPTYVLGYVMLDLFGITGPVRQQAKKMWGEDPSWFPAITSVGGVAFVMTLAFYPYVYLLARGAFRTHGRRAMEAARSLGYSPWRAFFRVALPMARPWIFGGLLLVSMETLADFGTVTIFNFDTFTTAIYKAWIGMFSLNSAARLATMLLLIALALFGLERITRSGRQFFPENTVPTPRLKLRGTRGWLAFLSCVSVLGMAFFLPMGRLVWWTFDTWQQEAQPIYLKLVSNTVQMGVISALAISATALLLACAVRVRQKAWTEALAATATMGYALPGTVLAVAVFLPIAWIDHRLADVLEALGLSWEIALNGTLVVMLVAYGIRFLAVAHQPAQAALERIRPSLDEAGRSLGHGRWAILRRIHVPLVRTGFVTAALLVLIDVMKEMPITLMTRPFHWDTLAIRIFELTSEGEYERAALPSILLVVSGLIPVFLLAKFSENSKVNHS